jgi:hypothetical protein
VRYVTFVLFVSLISVSGAHARAAESETYYVSATSLNVRLAPNRSGKITNRLSRQERVDVSEVRNGWARISRYYDGEVEGLTGQVARWVWLASLSKQRPGELAQPAAIADARISGIPKVGQGGLTSNDVQLLYRAASYFIDSGRCERVEYADKSVSKPNTYFVNCGEARNRFFKPSEIPGG